MSSWFDMLLIKKLKYIFCQAKTRNLSWIARWFDSLLIKTEICVVMQKTGNLCVSIIIFGTLMIPIWIPSWWLHWIWSTLLCDEIGYNWCLFMIFEKSHQRRFNCMCVWEYVLSQLILYFSQNMLFDKPSLVLWLQKRTPWASQRFAKSTFSKGLEKSGCF